MEGERKYDDIELKSEGELEDLLATDPSIIEPGMRLLARQWNTRRGPLDLLLLDQDGRAVVAELKLESDDDMLMQGLDYLGWVHENLDAIDRAFREYEVSADKAPRLILIARSFSDILRVRARYLVEEMQPTLLLYRTITHANERLAVLHEVEVAEMPRARAGPPRETDHRDYLVGDELRALWDQAGEHIRSLSADVVPSSTASYLGFKHQGRLVATLYPCKRYFWVSYYKDGEWDHYLKVADQGDLKQLVEDLGPSYLADALTGRPPE